MCVFFFCVFWNEFYSTQNIDVLYTWWCNFFFFFFGRSSCQIHVPVFKVITTLKWRTEEPENCVLRTRENCLVCEVDLLSNRTIILYSISLCYDDLIHIIYFLLLLSLYSHIDGNTIEREKNWFALVEIVCLWVKYRIMFCFNEKRKKKNWYSVLLRHVVSV